MRTQKQHHSRLPAEHYDHIQASLEKIRAIANRRNPPKTEEDLFLQTPAKYQSLQLTRQVWRELNHKPEEYSLNQSEKLAIKFKHFRYYNSPKFHQHLPPLPNF